jgi:hypothetical protein
MNSTPTSLVHRVNLTTARNLSPLFDEVVRQHQPVLIVRGRREAGVLLSRDAICRLLTSFDVHVDTFQEGDQGFTLWARELNIGGTGATELAARADLVSSVKAHIVDYWQQFDFYRHLSDLAAQEPYVLRLSLAEDDAELYELLFGGALTEERASDELGD